MPQELSARRRLPVLAGRVGSPDTGVEASWAAATLPSRVSGALLGGLVILCLGAAGACFSATLRLRRLVELVLAAYLIAYGAMVVLCLVLSLFGAMTRAALVIGSAAVAAAAVAVWLGAGRPRPAMPRAGDGRGARGPLLLLAVVVALSFAYVLALVLGTPPNGSDQLNYHLPRAAFWVELDRVGYIPNAYDNRLNSFAPNGEIGVAFVLDVTRNEIFAALVQLAAALACGGGIFALARRIRLSRAESAFGALLFLTLPIVLLQSASTKNDAVLASFLVAASVFVLGDGRAHAWLAGLATALAVGTKFTAFYGLIVLVAIALVAVPGERRVKNLAALAAGTAAGLYWYVLNVVETGRLFGDTSAFHGLTSYFELRENLYSFVGLAVDSIDLSGAKGADIVFYPLAALALVAGLAFVAKRSGSGDWGRIALAAALVASPLLLYVLAVDVGKPVLVHVLHALGNPPAYIPPSGNPALSPAFASDTGSWFGPIGFLFVIGIGVAALRLVRRGALPPVVEVFAVAPFAWLLLVGLTLTYLPWHGRFFIFPVALSASLWGLVLRVPNLGWAAAALALVTAPLVLVHYAEKPSGVELLDRTSVTSVWGMPRWQVQSLETHPPPIAAELRFLQDHVPSHDSIAVAIGDNDYGYPFFAPRLERRVQLVPFGSSASGIATRWLVANPARMGEIDRGCWHAVFSSSAGTVFRRAARCRAPA